nr:hypothetical protein [Bacteroidota bacterium]
MKNSNSTIQQKNNPKDSNFDKHKLFVIHLLLILLIGSMANAQSIKQIGPGAGGQERAVYIYPNPIGSYDLYVGSDVSGVWRATNIPANGFGNVNNYTYNFISNHEIMRFVNKFYRADMGNTHYLFCLNRSGIDRIDLNNYSSSMSTVPVFESSTQITMEDSWVSDMYVNATSKQTYFITGNTRVTDDGPGNFKATTANDIFTGTINSTYDRVDIIGKKELYDLSTTKRDVYCVYVDDKSNTDATDDIIFVGAENGLHIIPSNDLIGNGTLNPNTLMAGPGSITNYKVTSLFLKSRNNNGTLTTYSFVATVHGMGLYKVEYIQNNTNFSYSITWTLLSTNVKGINQGTPFGCNQSEPYLIPKFTKCLPVFNQQNIAGYYITNEINLEKLCTGSQANYFTGVYYCPADIDGFPDAGGLLPLTVWQPSLNDWGWNATKPAANINGALITPENTLLIGKQGNIFVTSNDNTTPDDYVHWHQVYDLQSTVANCNTENQYIHRGYINTANKTIYPNTKTDVWIGQADRLIFRDNNSNDYYHSIDATNTCYTFNYTGQSCGNGLGKNDCWFITNNTIDGEDQNIYIGIGEGYASQVGCGHVMFGDKDGNTFIEIGSPSINGDPRKILFTNEGNKFLLVNKTIVINPNNTIHRLRLFELINNIWTELDLSLVNNYAVRDAVISPDGKKIFAIVDDGNNTKFYCYNYVNGIVSLNCSAFVGDPIFVLPARLNLLRYGAHLENYKIFVWYCTNYRWHYY